MSSFSVDKKNEKLYMVYQAAMTEVIDGYTLGIVLNSPLTGIVDTAFSNDENGRKFTYNITGMITLKELFDKGIDEKIYVCLLASVAATLQQCEQYGLNIGNLILNEELIYVNEKDKSVRFICIPTSGFVSLITSKQLVEEFSRVLINNMKVTNNNILEIHNFVANNPQFDLADFIYRLNQYMLMNNINVVTEKRDSVDNVYEEVEKTKKPEEKSVKSENVNEHKMVENEIKNNIENNMEEKLVNVEENVQKVQEPIIHRVGNIDELEQEKKSLGKNIINDKLANKININPLNKGAIKNKVTDITKALGNIKNLGVIKDIKSKISNASEKKNNEIQEKEEYAQEIRQMVAEQKDADKRQQELMREKFDNNRLFDSLPEGNMAYASVGTVGETIMEDCITGETTDKNSISTAEPYLLRVSTGEKIIIDQSTFKLGRGKKFVDYYVGGNDTISKVHAYITNKANQYFLVDNSSRNHTFLDGKVLEPIEQMKLKHMSKIRLAKEEFVFYMY